MFGPTQQHTVAEWICIFGLVDKKKWVKNFLENEAHDYEDGYDTDDEYGISIIFDQEFEDWVDILLAFLEEQKLTLVFDNNCCWDTPSIGMEVMEYDIFTDAEKEKVHTFCEKYNLQSPTFYAGISGELE
jgi:hypothetical protein